MNDENAECKVQLNQNLKFKLSGLKIISISISLKHSLYMEDQGTICLGFFFFSFKIHSKEAINLSHLCIAVTLPLFSTLPAYTRRQELQGIS